MGQRGQGASRWSRWLFLALALMLVGAGLTACQNGVTRRPPPDEDPLEPVLSDSSPVLLIDFEDVAVRAGEIVGVPADGSASVTVGLVAAGNGSLVPVPDPEGGTAAGFPAHEAVEQGDLAALAVTPSGSDTLSPGARDFAFGLDVLPASVSRTDIDDGDNLMQRGLFGGAGQFKLQIDGGLPSCRVAGADGAVLVEATEAVPLDEWYRLRCERIGDRVDLFVGTFDDSGDVVWEAWSARGPTGEIRVGKPPATLSVGAKLNARRTLVVEAPDQFSGSLDRVVLVIEH